MSDFMALLLAVLAKMFLWTLDSHSPSIVPIIFSILFFEIREGILRNYNKLWVKQINIFGLSLVYISLLRQLSCLNDKKTVFFWLFSPGLWGQ